MLFNKNLKFDKNILDGNDLGSADLRYIPQFFRASPDYVYRLGGPLMRKFIDSLNFSSSFKYISIDSRVHMLMPGFYPCIPGWHCDDFYRPDNQQPDFKAIIENRMNCKHHAVVVGQSSFTEFINTPLNLEVPSKEQLKGKNLYKHFNELLKKTEFMSSSTTSGEIVTFDSFAFHRGVPATERGWRLFIRATESNCWEPKNEIRTQTQVYLTDPEVSW